MTEPEMKACPLCGGARTSADLANARKALLLAWDEDPGLTTEEYKLVSEELDKARNASQ